MVLMVLVLFNLFSYGLSAQNSQPQNPDNLITLEPIDLLWKVHIQYERNLTEKISLGIGAHYIYSDYGYGPINPFYKIEFSGRYYYKQGFYIQPMVGSGWQKEYKNIIPGTSVSWGCRRIFPNSHLVIDASIGLQYYPYPFANNIFYSTYDKLTWYAIGPCSLLIPRIALGYAFN